MIGQVNVPGASAADLAKVSQTAQEALEKAEQALSEGGGNVIKITFGSEFVGATYTITDGADETKTGTVPESCVVSVGVEGCNTEYTVSAAYGGTTYSNTVTTGAYYGQYSVSVTVFTATIVVTAVSGANVTAVCDGSTYSATAGSNGKATVTVKKSGTYTVSGTMSNASSSSASVSVTTDGGSYTASVSFITLTLTSPSGSTITVAKGSSSLTRTSTGSDLFYLPSTGTWTVTIASDDDSASGTVSATAYQAYTLTLAFVHIYGASWDGTSTTSWTRTDEAADFTDPVPYVSGASSYGSPFDDLQPWAGMEVSERTGGTMVSIPKFWYKITQSGSGLKIQIADKEVSGYSVSPAHMNRGDGSGERDVVYIGRYHCGSTAYKSVAGQSPKVSITRSTARSAIHNLGSNIWQMDFAMRFTIWLLYIVEFANWNSQAKIGYGCSNNSAVQAMGTAADMPYHTGTMQPSRTTYGVGVQYRYIEGLWDNCYDWMDGCYYSSSGMSVILNPSNFSDSSNGTVIGTPSSGYPSAFTLKSVSGLFPAFIPTAASGSDSTYSCDSWNFNASGPCLYVGGNYVQGAYLGLFYVNCNSASGTYGYFGCRLQELP